LVANKIPYRHVLPRDWQKFYNVGGKGKQTTTVWKNILKQKAQALFPDKKITLANADAYLITYFAVKTL
jgi:hypothetical protein